MQSFPSRPCDQNRLEDLDDLAQHPLSGSAHYFARQRLAVFACQKCGELHQPGWRPRRQSRDDRVTARSPARLAQRIQPRIVGLFAAIAFDTLTAREVNARYLSQRPKPEFVHQLGLPNAWLTRDKRDLPLVP